MDPFLAEIRIFPFGFAPQGWAACEGQLLPISRYTALFSIVGTIYGGDGRVTFGLPDLRGRAPMLWGQGPGLQSYEIGQAEGEEVVTLTQATVPPHSHALQAFEGRSENENKPAAGSAVADSQGGNAFKAGTPTKLVAMDPNSITPAVSADLPHENRMPSLALHFCIALEGIFPKRP